MTISSTTNRAQFNCNGSTTSFPFTFKYLADSDLQVYLSSPAGVVTLLTLNVDYEITPAVPGPGGTLSFLGTYLSSPPVSGYTLTILRFIARTQEVDFINGDSLDENNIEGMGDKLTMMVQDLDERIGRAVTVPPSSGISNISVPDPVAGAFLRWNLSGDGLENATYVDPTLITISDYWRAVIDGGDTLPEALTAMGLDPSLSTLTLPDNVTISDFIKTLLDDNDAAAARATLQIPAASESVAGLAELATQAEVDAGTDDSRIVTPHKLYATPGIYRKNVIINGDMRIAQRGTTFTSPATGAYTVDRWKIGYVSDAAQTISQSTDIPLDLWPYGEGFQHSLKWDITTADAAIAAGQHAEIIYNVEGYDFRPLAGKAATLSFWVKATKAGTYCVAFRNSVADRSYVKEYTVSQEDTWEKKTVNITFNYAGGTWDYGNGIGLQIMFALAVGSTFQCAPGSWQTGNYIGSENQVNALDNTANNFWLTGVQLEVGSVATPFEFLPYANELRLCQRYYEKSYEQIVPIGTVTSENCVFYCVVVTGVEHYFKFNAKKRVSPTITLYSTGSGASGKVRVSNGQDNDGGTTRVGTDSFGIYVEGISAGYIVFAHYTANSEL